MNWQKVRKDLLLATSSNFFDKFVGYLVILMLTRYLAKEQMGQFFFAASLATFFALFAELGTNKYLVREVATNPEKALDNLSQVITIRLPLLLSFLIILNGFTVVFKPELATIMFFTSVYTLFEEFSYSFGALLLGLRYVGYRVIISISARSLLAALTFGVINLQGDLNAILSCYVVANLVLVIFAYQLVRKKIGGVRLIWDPAGMKRVLGASWPLFVLTILGLIQFKIDTVMLGFMHSYAAVATYEAGFKLLEVSRFIIRPIGMIFYPLCSEMAARCNWTELKLSLKKMLAITGVLGGGATFIVFTTAQIIIPLVFGSKYNDSIPVLRVLFLSTPMLYMGTISTFLANAIRLERKAIRVMVAGVLLNITLNSIAIPLWGPLGAAWTTVISETVLTFWLIKLNFQQLQVLSSPGSIGTRVLPRGWLVSLMQKRKTRGEVQL